ncbi:hypothetical protein ABOZ80_05690 [Bacillus stercoris]|uniref:hypothetical protein n=1 Tax=Bacillus stercoris TaxID=2054641 RepID=UPI000A548C3F
MDKLQEIKARISKLKGYENAKLTDQYWMAKEHIDFLIDRTELNCLLSNRKSLRKTSVNRKYCTLISAGSKEHSATKWG